jgi:hypothetical protein
VCAWPAAAVALHACQGAELAGKVGSRAATATCPSAGRRHDSRHGPRPHRRWEWSGPSAGLASQWPPGPGPRRAPHRCRCVHAQQGLQGFGRAQGAGHVGVQAGGHVAGADQAGFGLVGGSWPGWLAASAFRSPGCAPCTAGGNGRAGAPSPLPA